MKVGDEICELGRGALAFLLNLAAVPKKVSCFGESADKNFQIW